MKELTQEQIEGIKKHEEEFKKAIKNLIELYGKNGQLKKKKRK